MQKLCTNPECSLEDLPEAMDDRETDAKREWDKSTLAAWHDDDFSVVSDLKLKKK